MKDIRRKVIGSIVIIGLIIIAVCNVFIYRSIADLTLAIGVAVMGSSCLNRLLKKDSAQAE